MEFSLGSGLLTGRGIREPTGMLDGGYAVCPNRNSLSCRDPTVWKFYLENNNNNKN